MQNHLEKIDLIDDNRFLCDAQFQGNHKADTQIFLKIFLYKSYQIKNLSNFPIEKLGLKYLILDE